LSLAPIVLFVYNRPDHTRRTVEALLKNSLAAQSDLWIFADGAKKEQNANRRDVEQVQAVRDYLRKISGFGQITIVEQAQNFGLAQSVIRGVSQVIGQSGKAIVMEDDMVCTTDFLQFMNEALQKYESNPSIFSISGYTYPMAIPAEYTSDVCLLPRGSSWGWGTWADRWEKVDWDVRDYTTFLRDKEAISAFTRGGEDLLYMLQKQQKGMISSWAIRWTYAHYKNHAYCLSPVQPKIHNIGADGSGTHLGRTSRYDATLHETTYRLPDDPQPDERLLHNLRRFFKPSPIRRLINRVILR
jgi:hypothetical protein